VVWTRRADPLSCERGTPCEPLPPEPVAAQFLIEVSQSVAVDPVTPMMVEAICSILIPPGDTLLGWTMAVAVEGPCQIVDAIVAPDLPGALLNQTQVTPEGATSAVVLNPGENLLVEGNTW
jgi:hypothetical protein